MTAQNEKSRRVGEYKNLRLTGKNVVGEEIKGPVVNRVRFRNMFGMISKFVQVGGDFV